MRFPHARRDDAVDVLHGVEIADPYRWLEDADAPDTIAWCAAQDDLAEAHLASLGRRDELRERFRALLAIGTVSVPVGRRGRSFFQRRTGGQEHAQLVVRDPDGAERVLLDPAELSPDHTVTLDAWSPSPDGSLLAYQLSEGGDEESVLSLMDVATGADLGERIDRVRYSPVEWLADGRSFIYVQRLPPGRVPPGEEAFHRRVWMHRLGTDPDGDEELFGEGRDPRTFYGFALDEERRLCALHASVGTDEATDVYLLDLDGDRTPRTVVEGSDVRTSAVLREGRIWLLTGVDAPRFRVCVADRDAPERWREVVAQDEATLRSLVVAGGRLYVSVMQDAVDAIRVHDAASGRHLSDLDVPALSAVSGLTHEPGTDDLFFGCSSYTAPGRVHLHRLGAGTTEVWANAPGEADAELGGIGAERTFAVSKDGTRVPVFVVRPEGAPVDGTRPGVLTGYGGFAVPHGPAFSAAMVAWAQTGGVFADACLRGGSEYGEDWHRAGMLSNKQNVFDDLHASAEHVVAGGYVARDRLAIVGGSNGGLLVGAALTQRPDLYAAVVCSAPLLDMVRYERFGLGRLWSGEYGSASDPDALRWLVAYSPYHNVRDGVSYPGVLFKTYESDSRVDPVHARKMCAALQHATASGRPVLLRRETKAGHAGKSISRTVDDLVDTYAFLVAEMAVAGDRPLRYGGTSGS